jgi:hypothetical protein
MGTPKVDCPCQTEDSQQETKIVDTAVNLCFCGHCLRLDSQVSRALYGQPAQVTARDVVIPTQRNYRNKKQRQPLPRLNAGLHCWPRTLRARTLHLTNRFRFGSHSDQKKHVLPPKPDSSRMASFRESDCITRRYAMQRYYGNDERLDCRSCSSCTC